MGMNEIKFNPMGIKTTSIDNMCNVAAKLLYEGYCLEQREDCGSLFLEWTKERFWGMVIRDSIPMYLKLWNTLNDNGYTSQENSLSYGDMDGNIWAEKDERGRLILIVDDHVTCADDNVHIYIYHSLGDLSTDWTTFQCITGWPKEVLAYDKPTWNDYRDIKYPSLETHRKHGFTLGCNDCRDKWFSFKYESLMGAKAKDAHYTEGRLNRALEKLRFMRDGVDYELEYLKQ